jgi:hypothetical protein
MVSSADPKTGEVSMVFWSLMHILTLFLDIIAVCRLLVPSVKNIEVEFVNVTTVKWMIMLHYSLPIQFRMQHDILLRNPGQMSYFSIATTHQSWGETGHSITVYRNVILHSPQSHGPYCRKCPAPSTADLPQSAHETTSTYPFLVTSLIHRISWVLLLG